MIGRSARAERPMITLTRRSDYALIALSHLAQARDGLSSAREIADRHRVSLPLLMNILKQLTRAGVVESVRGARGGYRLVANADEMSLGEFIGIVEGPVRLVQCADAGPSSKCDRTLDCPVRSPVLRVHRRLKQFLAEVPLTEIIGRPAAEGGPSDQSAEDETSEPSDPSVSG